MEIEPKASKGDLIVISGPSGVGKGTLLKEIFNRMEDLVFSISATTRQPRRGEVDGKDYFFIDEAEFKRMISENEFLEWAYVHNNYYGTPVNFILEQLENGKDVILDIDVQGARQVMEKKINAIFVFVAPPAMDIEILRERLLGRSTEDTESIESRLKTAREELKCAPLYEYVVFNGDLKEAALDLYSIIRSNRCRSKKFFSASEADRRNIL